MKVVMEKNHETFPHIPDEPRKLAKLFTLKTFVVYGIQLHMHRYLLYYNKKLLTTTATVHLQFLHVSTMEGTTSQLPELMKSNKFLLYSLIMRLMYLSNCQQPRGRSSNAASLGMNTLHYTYNQLVKNIIISLSYYLLQLSKLTV